MLILIMRFSKSSWRFRIIPASLSWKLHHSSAIIMLRTFSISRCFLSFPFNSLISFVNTFIFLSKSHYFSTPVLKLFYSHLISRAIPLFHHLFFDIFLYKDPILV
eukprot:UN25004